MVFLLVRRLGNSFETKQEPLGGQQWAATNYSGKLRNFMHLFICDFLVFL